MEIQLILKLNNTILVENNFVWSVIEDCRKYTIEKFIKLTDQNECTIRAKQQ